MGPLLAVLLAGNFASSACAANSADLRRWIVTFKADVGREGREEALAALGLTPAGHLATDGGTENEFSAALVELPVTEKIEIPPSFRSGARAIMHVEEDRRFNWIERTAQSFAPPASASRSETTWGINRVHAPAAWSVTEGAGVRVGVVDTGIDLRHADLIGRVDGGYGALAKSERPDDYQDDNGHGTTVAGIIGARRDGKGVVGVAPQARLFSVKVLDAEGVGAISEVVDGILWAVNNDMQIINLSLGSPVDSPALREAVRFAENRGVILIAAAGNTEGALSFPGAYPQVIAVSASDSDDRLAAFSSRGPGVRFIAPGTDIVSDKLGGGQISLSGTSMSAPFVTGLAALAVALGWTGSQGPDGVLAQLKKAAKPLPGLRPDEEGAGLIDAGRLAY